MSNTLTISYFQLTEAYVAELRNGTAPSWESLVVEFPEFESQIRADFPAIALLERTLGKPRKNDWKLSADQLGGCEIVSEIGRGAMGVVFKALHRQMNRHVAIKAIRLDRSPDSAADVNRFERESQIMASLEHESIIPIYNIGIQDDVAYIIMKFIEGVSLDRLLNSTENYQTQRIALELQHDIRKFAVGMRDVAAGLHHAHQKGVIHRDIKPANLILDKSFKLWIADFGLAKIFDQNSSLSRIGEVIGTPRYMAPEQMRGINDRRGDIYSLGITMYELAIAGQSKKPSLALESIDNELVDIRELNPEIPAEFVKIIMKACRQNPDERYQNAQELQVVLDRFLSGNFPSDRRKSKRCSDADFKIACNRNLKWSIVLSAVVGTAILGILINGLRSSESPTVSLETESRIVQTATNPALLLEKLADSKETEMINIVGDLVKESITDVSNRSKLDDVHQDRLINQIDRVVEKVKSEGLNSESLNSFLHEYRNSPLPLAGQIMSLSVLLDKTRFSNAEMQSSYQVLKMFARAVVNRRLAEEQAIQLITTLSPDGNVQPGELHKIQVSDDRLRKWLAAVHSRIELLAIPIESESPQVVEELERLINSNLIRNGR